MQEKDKLEKLIELGLTISEIAKKVNLSITGVRYWLKKYKLKTEPLFYLDRRNKYSDEYILEVWSKSDSVNQFLLNIGNNRGGGAWYHYKKRLLKLGVDLSNSKINGQKRGAQITAQNQNQKSLKRNVRLSRVTLKKGMDLANISYKCNLCNLTEWNNKPILLHIHHKDHNKGNNAVENLEYLCPNCHSQQHYAK